jgi:hypothetical protein
MFHPFDQNPTLVEKTPVRPEGMTLHLRGFAQVEAALKRAGFADVEFHPFEIPIDLPRLQGADELQTHTVKMADGKRLNLRGAIYQPWCHLVARRGN